MGDVTTGIQAWRDVGDSGAFYIGQPMSESEPYRVFPEAEAQARDDFEYLVRQVSPWTSTREALAEIREALARLDDARAS